MEEEVFEVTPREKIDAEGTLSADQMNAESSEEEEEMDESIEEEEEEERKMEEEDDNHVVENDVQLRPNASWALPASSPMKLKWSRIIYLYMPVLSLRQDNLAHIRVKHFILTFLQNLISAN